MTPLKFAVVGINHDHIFGQCEALLNTGAQCVGYYGSEDDLAGSFASRLPGIPRVDDPDRLFEDDSIVLIVSAAINSDRAGIAIKAMRHGKDVMVDKPGMTSLEDLAAVQAVQAETKRIFSILYSEHFSNKSTVKALDLVRSGAIGHVIHVSGFGPHRIRKAQRPDWFFNREKYGGILCDIASHQFEQFLAFTGASTAKILSASVANFANHDRPGLQDYGDAHLQAEGAVGYLRVDWFTPDGLPTWGDGRLTIVGTDGTIELRKYIDIAGRPGGNHLFLTDRTGVQYVDCSNVALPYGAALIHDIRHRTETAMRQAHCFEAMRLALTAQKMAEDAAAARGSFYV